jgi:3-isopropylmalate dehydrogenase
MEEGVGSYNIAVLPGDGIGPEVIRAGVDVLESVAGPDSGLDLRFEHYEAGAELYTRTGVAMPAEVFQACKAADAIFFVAVGHPDVRLPDGTEVHGEVMFKLRFDLDLYAGLRPIKLYPGITGPLRNAKAIDYVIMRENVEGLYAAQGGGNVLRGEVATDTLIITRKGTERIVDWAFRLARKRGGRPSDGKRVVTCVDKANVLRSYAYFRRVFDDVAARYPEIGRDYAYVDAMTLWQVLNPEQYDVVVSENTFGDIISDLAAATIGGLGMAPSGDIGDEHAVFQPSHGTAPSIAGKNIANPLATILSGGLMLDWLGERHGDEAAVRAGRRLETAVACVLAEGKALPVDLGGHSSSTEVGEAVCRALGSA